MKFRSVAALFAILAMSVSVSAQDLFFENFDGKTTSDLEAEGWSFEAAGDPPANTGVVDDLDFTNVEFNLIRTRDLNPGGERGAQTTGEYLMSDADRGPNFDMEVGTGQAYDAITPSIDASNANQVWLNMDTSVCLNNNGTAVFIIDVSVNGGEFQEVEARVAPARFVGDTNGQTITEEDGYILDRGKDGNMGGLYGPYWLDISEVAAGQSDVRVRFRHFEQDWDWWVALDNIRVTTQPAPMGAETIYGPEGFEGTELPSDWTFETTFIDNEWFHGSQNIVQIDSIIHHESLDGENPYKDGNSLDRLADINGEYVIFQSIPELSGTALADTATLTSPAIDCSDYQEVFYYSWVEFLPGPTDQVNFFIDFSVDGGENWDVLYDFNQGLLETQEGSRAQEYYLPVPEAAGVSDFHIRYRAVGANGEDFFAVDDVTITGNIQASVDEWNLF